MDLKDQIKKLAEKAVSTEDGGDAMRFSQAACNLANAMETVKNSEKNN